MPIRAPYAAGEYRPRPAAGAGSRAARRRIVGLGVAVVVAAALLSALPPVERFDLFLLDSEFALLRDVAPKPVVADVVVVGIDEATLDAFPEPFALWHEPLAEVFAGLAAASPRAVGVDVALPERSYDTVRPGLDRALAAGILALRNAAPLVLAITVDAGGRPKPLHAPFRALAGPDGTGFALWAFDADGRVRRFDERLGEAGRPLPTLVGTVARSLGREPGVGIVDYAVGPRFGYVPAQRVRQWQRDGDTAALAAAFGDRVVLVGGVLPFIDRFAQPVNLAGWEDEGGQTPGVLLHAQALRSVLGAGLVSASPPLVPALLAALGGLLWFAGARFSVAAPAVALTWLGALAGSVLALRSGYAVPVAGLLAASLLAAAARWAYEAWFQRQEQARIKASLSGYLSESVMRLVVEGRLATAVGRRALCVLFSDLRNFTPYSERHPAEHVVALLNRYFERMTAQIHRHDGTVDNFRGDGIMCIFGAPKPSADPCRDGFGAATGMIEALRVLNDELAAEGVAPLAMGLSLAFGDAVVGPLGSSTRHVYSAIGDIVNVAARIEGLTKALGYPLLVDEAVARALAADATFDDLGPQELKGHTPVRIYGWPARAAAAPADGRGERDANLA